MEKKPRKYYIDWWKIRKSTIWSLSAIVVVVTVITVGGWLAIRHDWFSQVDAGAPPKGSARIMSFEGDVRITRAATRETLVVQKLMYIAPGDTIQTQSDGRALVQMVDGSVYSVRPNSTVVIRDNSTLFGGMNVRVALDDGQLNVRTDQQPENSENVVEMMDSETKLRSQTDASFNADAVAKGGEIRISRGSVETSIGGEHSTLNADEYAALSNGKITSREKLLGPPHPGFPGNMSQIVDATGAGLNVTFTWQDDVAADTTYYLQVSKSPTFASDAVMVDRGGLTSQEFRLAGLTPGNYYWRLKASTRSGQVSEWNDPWRFTVTRRGSNPSIGVAQWNVERVGGNVYIISGSTQPGLRVRAQDRETNAGGDGLFRFQIATPLSELAVELADDRGTRAGFVLSLNSGKVLRRF
ncbi:MAG: FecR domain-containing protein [Pyrinomonadaceae bacterium]